ncbi:T9SS type A sorting domain-containing protein [Flavobacterium sp. CYK-4]|uniref:T9SS-dependent choice-of-anchor J family protein n=1 Tax=Flavobacterium lotistagni TaxID=2709660 RepID=UPI00140BFFAE|nr:choice-of-anchor J domain-containing protein [Flavobacterium lotistagni]NHM08116.1 T9SS type A sorting domain-containing protein [Flavobacterium lotistagni]
MKIKLFSALLVLVSMNSYSQTLLAENFDTFPTTWTATNQSQPVGVSNWQQGTTSPFGAGFNGGSTSYARVNYNSVAAGMAGTISNWLISPSVSLVNGDVIKFYTRAGANFSTPPDRLEFRLSTAGDASVIPSTGSSDLGSFTTVGVTVNPNLAPNVYPVTWTEYTYTVTDLPNATDCKLGFRYYVTNGGPTGANGNAIWLDAITINRVLATDTFFKSHFTASPNPASDVINISNNTDIAVNTIQLTDMNGRVVKEVKGMTNQINVNELNAGVYFLKITTDQGTGTTKIIKK